MTTTKIERLRDEVLRVLDREIASHEERVKRQLGWVRNTVENAIRDMEDPGGVVPSNGFLLRNSSTHELDLAAAALAALKELRREIGSTIDWIEREKE